MRLTVPLPAPLSVASEGDADSWRAIFTSSDCHNGSNGTNGHSQPYPRNCQSNCDQIVVTLFPRWLETTVRSVASVATDGGRGYWMRGPKWSSDPRGRGG